jgi:hypothetical protein
VFCVATRPSVLSTWKQLVMCQAVRLALIQTFVLNTINLSSIQHAKTGSSGVEGDRHREFTLTRDGLSDHLDAGRPVRVDREKSDGIGARLSSASESETSHKNRSRSYIDSGKEIAHWCNFD